VNDKRPEKQSQMFSPTALYLVGWPDPSDEPESDRLIFYGVARSPTYCVSRRVREMLDIPYVCLRFRDTIAFYIDCWFAGLFASPSYL
jgi:hypothetical protein